jgi:hypothetical protein
MFGRSDLDELVEVEAQPAVLLYLPTHVGTKEIRQDPIRLKNLLSAAAERLAVSRRRPELDALLAPAKALAGNHAFWEHEEQGLAVFLAPDFHRVHKLAIAVPETIAVADHFSIKPLLPLIENAGPFWLLTISAKQTRLYQASRWTLTEITTIDLPQGVAQIRGMSEYEETQYASQLTRRGTSSHSQSFGPAPDEVGKTELLELLHRIAAAVEPCIKRSPAPLLLAAQSEILGNFRKIAGWKEIEAEGIRENPDSAALGRNRRHVVLGVARRRSDHYAQG